MDFLHIHLFLKFGATGTLTRACFESSDFHAGTTYVGNSHRSSELVGVPLCWSATRQSKKTYKISHDANQKFVASKGVLFDKSTVNYRFCNNRIPTTDFDEDSSEACNSLSAIAAEEENETIIVPYMPECFILPTFQDIRNKNYSLLRNLHSSETVRGSTRPRCATSKWRKDPPIFMAEILFEILSFSLSIMEITKMSG